MKWLHHSRITLPASVVVLLGLATLLSGQSNLTATLASFQEALTGFDNQTNGVLDQAAFDEAKEVFAEQENNADGLGPVYNAQSCGECHQNPVTGGGSQVFELRAGYLRNGFFVDTPGGSLIHSRAINAEIQEQMPRDYDVKSFRGSLSTLGDGYVEAIADETLVAISNSQPAGMRGEVIRVPVSEANDALRVGRFGWKNQQASLLSFAADAYLNEMGITSPLQPAENTSMGESVAAYDSVPDPEDLGEDLELFASFMRSTKAPPRNMALANSPDAQAGGRIFARIGCAVCHVPSIATAPAGTKINGGTFTIPAALGSKIIHPFSDFLLHDIGTGDGIVQNGGPSTRNKVRTAPLWGLRTRNRLMHDGESMTMEEAVLRHRGEALGVTLQARGLSAVEKRQLLAFLSSL